MTTAAETSAPETTAAETTAAETTAAETTAAETTAAETAAPVTGERADLLELLTARREFLRFTVEGLTDQQAASHPVPASVLSLGGLIKHVARTEAGWANFAVDGPTALSGEKDWTEWGEEEFTARANEFQMIDGDTLTGLLEEYAAVARRTDELVRTLPDLDAAHPLPKAPWFQEDAQRSVRQVFLHIAAETAQHAGHADLLRETIDGQKTMG